jgi:DNA-binding GntR family transcriptional regulator
VFLPGLRVSHQGQEEIRSVTDVPQARVSLGEAAYLRLRDDIISCRLTPGQRLTERGLSLQTGIGISPIRDALTRLDNDGLVRTLPRKGYQVTPLTPKSVDDLFVLWRIVGPEIARLGVENGTAAHLRETREAARAAAEPGQRLRSESDETMRRLDISRTLFAVLADATGNDYLVSLYHRLEAQMSRVWAFILQAEMSEGSDFRPEAGWEDILRRRDSQAAADHTRGYIEHAHGVVLTILSRWPSVFSSEVTPIRRG